MRIPPIQRGQVAAINPNGRIEVVLSNGGIIGKQISVRCLSNRAHPTAGEFQLPSPGDWVVIGFTSDSYQNGFILGYANDDHRNLIPEELWTDDPYVTYTHHSSDTISIQHGDGTYEHHLPDGSLLKITTRKDGKLSNASQRGKKSALKRRMKTDKNTSERQTYTPHSEPPADVVFNHVSGASFTITADGSVTVKSAKHTLKFQDGTEKIRSATSGAVTSAPQEDAGRVASNVILETEKAIKLTLHDDPELKQDNRFARLELPEGVKVTLHTDPVAQTAYYVLLETPSGPTLRLNIDPKTQANIYAQLKTELGHTLELRDKPDPQQKISLKSAAGHLLELRDKIAVTMKLQTVGGHGLELQDSPAPFVRLKSTGGRILEQDDVAAETSVVDPAKVRVTAPLIHLGGSVRAVGRVGDAVEVRIPAGVVLVPGNVPNPVPIILLGEIIEGSTKVFAG